MTLIPVALSLWASLFESTEMADTSRAHVSLKERRARALQEHAVKSREGLTYEAIASDASPENVSELLYTFVSKSLPLKLTMLFIGAATVAAFAALIPRVELGYEYTDLAKRGSYLARGIDKAYAEVYSQYSAETVVFGTGIDYTVDQARHRSLSWQRPKGQKEARRVYTLLTICY